MEDEITRDQIHETVRYKTISKRRLGVSIDGSRFIPVEDISDVLGYFEELKSLKNTASDIYHTLDSLGLSPSLNADPNWEELKKIAHEVSE